MYSENQKKETQVVAVDGWNMERRSSVDLLDLSDVPSIQPNSFHQLEQHLREIPEEERLIDTGEETKTQNNELQDFMLDKKDENSLSKQQQQEKKKLLYTSIQKFDPLQLRVTAEEKKTIPHNSDNEENKAKIIPTRLPTPRRPILQSHLSAEQLDKSNQDLIQVEITPPSSPGRRVRHTSIARLVKPTSSGKANRELAEFDPLISPIKEKRGSTTSNNMTTTTTATFTAASTTKNHKDILTFSSSSNTTSTKKGGVQNSFDLLSTNNLMKQERKSTTPPKAVNNSNNNNNTRIPLPISVPQQQGTTTQNNHTHSKEVTVNELLQGETQIIPTTESSISRFNNNKDDQLLLAISTTTATATATTATTATAAATTTASKLRKPEVIVPKSIKILPTQAQTRKEISINYSRRPSYPTAANEILQEQWDKEREKSRRLSANLISAQGVITQPIDDENESFNPPLISRTASHESRIGKIHDRLQCLVDVTGSAAVVENEEPIITDYKRESGNTKVMSPKTALSKYRPYLSPYEKTEIMRYSSIYCVGSHAKKHLASTDETAHNYGYDDDKGDYKVIFKDHLNYRYEIVESLGKGSFGQVVKCKDHKPSTQALNNEEPIPSNLVAIKIIRNKKRFHAQAQTEVKILEQLMAWDPKNKHYNVRMLDSFYFRDHLCIVFECLSLNLYEILQQNSYQGFSMGLVKRFAYQILTALKLLCEHNVIHCDLKPENILLRQPDRSGIRVIDYGSSCFVNQKVYTYIQSRFYRAPEVILGMDYGLAIDMWSTGCILAELYTGRPLFPGENEPDQLACIMQLIGVPTKDYLEKCSRKKQFFDMYDQPRKSINSKGKKRRPNTMTFTEALKRSTYDNFDRDFGDFISKCLTWEPEERMRPIEALNHPWVQAMKK